MCCPFHEEKTPSFFYNLEKKYYHCFGCKVSGDVFDYITKKLNQPGFKSTIDFLVNFLGLDPNSISPKQSTDQDYKKMMRAMNKGVPKKKDSFTYFTPEDVKAMIQFRGTFFLDRGFTKETLDTFEAGFDTKENRVVLPIYDEHNVLCGATGRTIYKDYKERNIPKWRHYKGSNISENFFNIGNGILYSKTKSASIIICEGPCDVMWLHQHGYPNTIACLNNNITKVQKSILLRNFMNVYLFLDGDSGGDNGKSIILKEIKGYFNIWDVRIPKGKDPDNLNKQEIDGLINSAQRIV